MKKYIAPLVAVLLISGACGNKKRPERIEMKSSEEEKTNVTTGGNILKLADFTMKIPANWKKAKPSSEMRMMEFAIPGAEANMAGFYFGNRPKMVDGNIERWRGQFTEQDSFDRKKLDEGPVFVKITGTYKKKPFPMAQKFTKAPGFMTLAAIVPSNQGPYFFKLVGKEDNLKKVEPDFMTFLKSYSKQ